MLETVAAVKNILCNKATHTMRVFDFIVSWLYSNCNKIINFLKGVKLFYNEQFKK